MADSKTDFLYEGAHRANKKYGNTPDGRQLLSDDKLGKKVIDDAIKIEQLKYKVAHDTLTEISSRDELYKTYEEIIATNEIVCMLYVDVDKFKNVNDAHGHPAGDQVLNILAGRLKSHVQEDDIVAREGGEEFVMLLRNFDNIDIAEKRANDLREEIKQKRFLLDDGVVLGNTISIGVSVRNKNETLESWRNRTDRALYKAKNTGRDRVVVAQSV